MLSCFLFAYQILKDDEYSLYIDDVDSSEQTKSNNDNNSENSTSKKCPNNSNPPPRPVTSHPGCRGSKFMSRKRLPIIPNQYHKPPTASAINSTCSSSSSSSSTRSSHAISHHHRQANNTFISKQSTTTTASTNRQNSLLSTSIGVSKSVTINNSDPIVAPHIFTNTSSSDKSLLSSIVSSPACSSSKFSSSNTTSNTTNILGTLSHHHHQPSSLSSSSTTTVFRSQHHPPGRPIQTHHNLAMSSPSSIHSDVNTASSQQMLPSTSTGPYPTPSSSSSSPSPSSSSVAVTGTASLMNHHQHHSISSGSGSSSNASMRSLNSSPSVPGSSSSSTATPLHLQTTTTTSDPSSSSSLAPSPVISIAHNNHNGNNSGGGNITSLTTPGIGINAIGTVGTIVGNGGGHTSTLSSNINNYSLSSSTSTAAGHSPSSIFTSTSSITTPSSSSSSFIFPPGSASSTSAGTISSSTPTSGVTVNSNLEMQARNSAGIIHQPVRGWLHPDHKITDTGVSFSVRYVGCLEINTPMKSLDFETRSQVAKECINRVCEAGGLKTMDKKRRQDKRICKMLLDKPNMENAGANVNLTITSSYLNLSVMETGEVIAKHEMPNISFASGGDVDTLDFVAYVAKDDKFFRACFVLECGGGSAQDVISTIGQAFELRFKEFLKKQPGHKSGQERTETSKMSPLSDISNRLGCSQVLEGAIGGGGGEERDYYNDMPGKVPPDLPEKEKNKRNKEELLGRSAMHTIPRLSLKKFISNSSADNSPNLIDLTSDIQPTTTDSLQSQSGSSFSSLNRRTETGIEPEHEYVNCNSEDKNSKHSTLASSIPPSSIRDPFDMQPFYSAIEDASKNLGTSDVLGTSPGFSLASDSVKPKSIESGESCSFIGNNNNIKSSIVKNSQLLAREAWFHGPISRKESEMLVINDGDFLVRESQGSPGQYVLTGMQGGVRKHLLLVDPEGKVRTQDQTFESVTHLINYHRDNGLPIISAESALVLRNPVTRR
ncbi:SHC-adaptor protein isoform X2 [Brevipalpus obovatus]|uniref:SHC-adaptor protein isoform X2 n=1 Tax=Brevipalpus obovatus TaxID=246614 RepID=UPI003D9F920E